MDYDDGFAAYLNGMPIARSINHPNGPLQNNMLATPEHEATLYADRNPEPFSIDVALFKQLLRIGTNVETTANIKYNE